MNHIKLGKLIRKVEGNKNKQLKDLPLLGINIDKEFMPSVANTIGTDMSNYQIVKREQFACNPMHLGRDERMPTALLLNQDEILVSPAYFVFEVIDKNIILPEYLMLYFKQPETDRLLWFKTDSSVRGGLGWNELCDIEIPVPDLQVQKDIIRQYNQISDAIKIKEKLNNNLEQQAQAIFKSWFVDFEPFGGEMPSDWSEIPLENLCSVVTKGTTPTTLGKEFVDKGINFIKAESILSSHCITPSKFAYIDEDTNQLLKRSIIHDKDILFTIAGTLGRFAMADKSIIPANTNQAVAIIRVNKNKINPDTLFSFFIGDWHNTYYQQRVQQAVQANLSLTTIKSLPIIIPDKDTMTKYESIVCPLIKYKHVNDIELRYLTELRDAILPKLMLENSDSSTAKLSFI